MSLASFFIFNCYLSIIGQLVHAFNFYNVVIVRPIELGFKKKNLKLCKCCLYLGSKLNIFKIKVLLVFVLFCLFVCVFYFILFIYLFIHIFWVPRVSKKSLSICINQWKIEKKIKIQFYTFKPQNHQHKSISNTMRNIFLLF